MRCFSLVSMFLLLSSCDNMLFLPYEFINDSGEPIQIRIKNSKVIGPPCFYLMDTTISLASHEMTRVAIGHAIGFPWETRKIFRR
jgi:hypothetical protein